jgi:hypothetical protein
MIHPTLTAVLAFLALGGLCLGQWSRIMHPADVFSARVWQTIGLMCGFAAIEVSLFDLGPDWFKQQPIWAYLGLLIAFGALWWMAIGDKPHKPLRHTEAPGAARSEPPSEVAASCIPATTPLIEAATQAYETARARKALSAAFSSVDFKDSGRLQDNILTWYCWALGDKIDIYGNWPPSRRSEKIDWHKCRNTHAFEINGETLIFKDRYSEGYFENLHVLTGELPEALQKVDAMG